MPPKPPHEKKPKAGNGPKERELAVALSAAILGASDLGGASVSKVEGIALALYRRVLAEVGFPKVADEPVRQVRLNP